MLLRYPLLRRTVIGCALFFPVAGSSATLGAQTQSTAPDNSAANKSTPTNADNQSHNATDRDITRRIRQAVVGDKSLSTYGHNVKIVSNNGAVTLTGPVHSDAEKQAIAAHAAEVVGADKVNNQLAVKQ